MSSLDWKGGWIGKEAGAFNAMLLVSGAPRGLIHLLLRAGGRGGPGSPAVLDNWMHSEMPLP